MVKDTLYWSKGCDPLRYPDINSCGIGGLDLSLIPDAHIARFSHGKHHCDITLQQIVSLGDDWVNRKLYKFRRYSRRMKRGNGI